MTTALRYPLVIHAMCGWGDSIYQRPFVRYHAEMRAEVFLKTPLPALFADIPGVRFVQPDGMDLRTQLKSMSKVDPSVWAPSLPIRAERIRVTYRLDRPGESILAELRRIYGVANRPDLRLDAPDFGSSPVKYTKYAVVRPVTLRRECLNIARPPLAEYVAQAASALQSAGYRVVSVADIQGREEWAEGSLPPADREFLAGELDVRQLGALIQHASVVVGGSGFLVPFATALRVPAIFIGGGQGGYNAPNVVTDRNYMDLARVRWILPDHYCLCRKRLHECSKTISDFAAKFITALEDVAPMEAAA